MRVGLLNLQLKRGARKGAVALAAAAAARGPRFQVQLVASAGVVM
jgi:hypothetical protein